MTIFPVDADTFVLFPCLLPRRRTVLFDLATRRRIDCNIANVAVEILRDSTGFILSLRVYIVKKAKCFEQSMNLQIRKMFQSWAIFSNIRIQVLKS